MPLSDTLQMEGFRAQRSVSADCFRCLSDATQFCGVLELLPEIDPRLELGADEREVACIHIEREHFPFRSIRQEGKLQQLTARDQPIWKAIKCHDNPADIVIRLYVVKVVPGKDQ